MDRQEVCFAVFQLFSTSKLQKESNLQILLGHLYFRSLKFNYLKENAKVEYGVQLTFTSYMYAAFTL